MSGVHPEILVKICFRSYRALGLAREISQSAPGVLTFRRIHLCMLTIGHSTLPIDIFIHALQENRVALLVDVRTIPRSRHNPQFGSEELSSSLRSEAIQYRWMQSLGGLRHSRKDSINMGWHNTSFRGYADYMQTDAFAAALKELMALDGETTVAIMCSEAVPWRCHRSLIGDALLVQKHPVEDIFVTPAGKNHRRLHTLTSFARIQGKKLWYPEESTPLPLHKSQIITNKPKNKDSSTRQPKRSSTL